MSFKLRKISPICSAFKYESNQRAHWTNIYPLCKVPQQSPSSLAVNASGSGLCGLAISDIAVRMMPSALTSCSAGGRLTAYKKVAAVSLHSLIPASRSRRELTLQIWKEDPETSSWNISTWIQAHHAASDHAAYMTILAPDVARSQELLTSQEHLPGRLGL